MVQLNRSSGVMSGLASSIISLFKCSRQSSYEVGNGLNLNAARKCLRGNSTLRWEKMRMMMMKMKAKLLVRHQLLRDNLSFPFQYLGLSSDR